MLYDLPHRKIILQGVINNLKRMHYILPEIYDNIKANVITLNVFVLNVCLAEGNKWKSAAIQKTIALAQALQSSPWG